MDLNVIKLNSNVIYTDLANNDRLREIFWAKRGISNQRVGFKGSMFKGSELTGSGFKGSAFKGSRFKDSELVRLNEKAILNGEPSNQ